MIPKKPFFVFSLVAVILLSTSACQNPQQPNNQQTATQQTPHTPNANQGLKILQNQCTACHFVNPNKKGKIAPSLAEIHQRYVVPGKSLETLTQELAHFLYDPSDAIVKMPKAVQRYGQMPQINLSQHQVQDVAAYLYQMPQHQTP